MVPVDTSWQVVVTNILTGTVCPCRYDSHSGGEREIQRTMLELLNQLDGFDSGGDVKVRCCHSLCSNDSF